MRVLVCGGRDFSDYLHFAFSMNALNSKHGPFQTVIHGGAPGADWCAHLWADSGRLHEIEYKANWKTNGHAAGPIRNQLMLDDGKPDLVVAFPGGRGTADMVRRAKSAGIQVVEVPARTPTEQASIDRSVIPPQSIENK